MKITQSTLVLNAAVALIGVLSVAVIVRNYLASEEVLACAERYEQGVMYSVERRAGELASGADLQARMAGRDWGVIENVNAVATGREEFKHALEIRIPKGAHGPAGTDIKSGMSFPWTPRSLKRTGSACLGYRVWFAPGFEFAMGGRLPALKAKGRTGDEKALAASEISARMVWGPGGKGDMIVVAGSGNGARMVANERAVATFEPGRWTQIEFEVALNTPEQRDGILRVWIDGELKADRRNVVFREAPDVAIDGIASEVIAGTVDPGTAARREMRVRVTPFELRWH